MPLWLRIIMLSSVGFAFGFAGIYSFMNDKNANEANANEKPVETDWATLRELDLKTGAMPGHLRKLDGQRVRIPGFIVPLEDDQNAVSEFLLVPSPTACIHTPPPPGNQMIHVRMAGGRTASRSWGPVWLQGRLRITDIDGPYGKSSYELLGELTEPYR